MFNDIYMLTGQRLRGISLFVAERALGQTLPKFSRLVAVFGQEKLWRKKSML
jgi:hypothetical protein